MHHPVTPLPEVPLVQIVVSEVLREGHWLHVPNFGLLFVAPDRLEDAKTRWPDVPCVLPMSAGETP